MASKKKTKPDDLDMAMRDARMVNRSLMEDSLSLAATQRGVNEDFDMEARERVMEQRPVRSNVKRPVKKTAKKPARKKAKRPVRKTVKTGGRKKSKR